MIAYCTIPAPLSLDNYLQEFTELSIIYIIAFAACREREFHDTPACVLLGLTNLACLSGFDLAAVRQDRILRNRFDQRWRSQAGTFGDTGKDASWLEHGCLYLEHQDNLDLAEGQVVACFTFGNKLLGIAPDMAKTERRRAEIQAIIWRINPNAPASD